MTPTSKDGTFKQFDQWLNDNHCNGKPSLVEIQTVVEEDVAYNYGHNSAAMEDASYPAYDHNSAAMPDDLYPSTRSLQLDGYLHEGQYLTLPIYCCGNCCQCAFIHHVFLSFPLYYSQ